MFFNIKNIKFKVKEQNQPQVSIISAVHCTSCTLLYITVPLPGLAPRLQSARQPRSVSRPLSPQQLVRRRQQVCQIFLWKKVRFKNNNREIAAETIACILCPRYGHQKIVTDIQMPTCRIKTLLFTFCPKNYFAF